MEHEPITTAVDALAPLSAKSTNRILEPMDRISEVLFGLIMALTFTLTLGVVTADSIQVQTMLLAALGCNLGNHRRRRVSDGSLQRAGAQRHEAACDTRGRRYPRRTSRHRGRAAAPAGVGLAASPAGIDAAKIGPIARARASAADKARWAWRGGHLLAQFRVDLSDRHPVHSDRRRAIGASFVQCGCDRDVVRVRICVRALRRVSTVGTGLLMVAIGAALVGIAIALGG
jgi:hypothetical protein